MRIVYAGEPFPNSINKTLYLAGPSPRDPGHPNWRENGLRLLREADYDGHVFIPLPRDGRFPQDYVAQADWEQKAVNRSDVLMFWVPRDLEQLPGFTTNVEFGQQVRSRNVVLGYPPEAPRCRFLGYLGDRNFVDRAGDIETCINLALEKIGDGAKRVGGECEVPLYLWNTPHFTSWLNAQKGAGNRLDGCNVELTFGVGPRKAFLLYWAAHVNIYVASENRNKDNEIVLGRPDIKHTVAFVPADHWHETRVLLVKEFRSTAVTSDGFIREVPGGSGFKPAAPEVEAAKEFAEETGIPIDSRRLRALSTRQVAGTTTSHSAHVFAVKLTAEELETALRLQDKKTRMGVAEETEWTYVEVYTVGELLDQPITDWSSLGMIFAAISQADEA